MNAMKAALAACLALLPVAVHAAGSSAGSMSNYATVADACDVAATGVDFGITTFPLPAAGITSTTANTATGNAITGNTGVSGAGADTGDSLSVSTSVGAIDLVVNTALSTLTAVGLGTLPGVYVICTTTPTSITLASGSNSVNLSVSAGASTATFTSKMSGTGGSASSANQISYTLTLSGTPVSAGVTGLPINVFSAAYLATGTISSSQPGNTIVSGSYSDVATATVNF